MSDLIAEGSLAHLDKVRALQNQIRAAAADAQKLKDRVAALQLKGKEALRVLRDGEERLQRESVDAVLAGKDPEKPAASFANEIRKAKRVSDASEEAVKVLRGELQAKEDELRALHSTLAGEIYVVLTQEMNAAGAAIQAELESLGPLAARLIAIDEARQHFCPGDLKLGPTAAELRPWSGATVATNLLTKIPRRFRSDALSDEAVSTAARPLFNSICNLIDGEQQ